MRASIRNFISRTFSIKSTSALNFDTLAAIISNIQSKVQLPQSVQFKSFVLANRQKLKNLAQYKTDFDFIQAEYLKEKDANLKELFDTEINDIKDRMHEINQELLDSIHLSANEGIKNVVVEIRPGTGGDEAAIFAKELSSVYENFFKFKNWNYEIISEQFDSLQAKELIYSLSGDSYADLRFETGVHRVQRVPQTDSQGRVHTSTVTVAVIPQYEDDRVILNEKDVRMDVFRSSGPGGQNVNKTNSAVRLVHIATGITVSMQDERSQILNKLKAFKVLEHRLQERRRSLKSEAIKTLRNDQIGAGERADKIRTYNFPQNRLTDHRSGLSTQNLPLLFEDPSILEKYIESNKIIQIARDIKELEEIFQMSIK